MRDYWLSQFLFDMQQPALRASFKTDPAAAMRPYAMSEAVRKAVLDADLEALAPLVNPYLLRYYFGYIGMQDEEFLRRIRRLAPSGVANG